MYIVSLIYFSLCDNYDIEACLDFANSAIGGL